MSDLSSRAGFYCEGDVHCAFVGGSVRGVGAPNEGHAGRPLPWPLMRPRSFGLAGRREDLLERDGTNLFIHCSSVT